MTLFEDAGLTPRVVRVADEKQAIVNMVAARLGLAVVARLSSLLRLRLSEIRQAVTRLGADVIGYDSLAIEPSRPLYELGHEPPIPEMMLPVVPAYLNGRAYTIFGGTSEIQRDIIARLVLYL